MSRPISTVRGMLDYFHKKLSDSKDRDTEAEELAYLRGAHAALAWTTGKVNMMPPCYEIAKKYIQTP